MKDINWFISRLEMWRDEKAIITPTGFYTYTAMMNALHAKQWKTIEPSPNFNAEWLYGVLAQKAPKVTVTTSGSTGKPKKVSFYVADYIEQYREKVPTPYRMIAFLLFDHVGGLNTLFRSLASGGNLILPKSRSVQDVCTAIENNKATCLPTTPSFLNMLLMTGAHITHDLSSLRVISFGTEVMPEETMARLLLAFPKVRFSQTYGTTEAGVLKVKTNLDNPLLIKVENTFIDGGTLWIRKGGELINTGDLVEQHPDGWIRIIGRQSEVINVGGQKVHPLELEEAFLKMPEVDDVVVWGEGNPLMGQVVCAKFNLNMNYTSQEWKHIIWERVNGYKRPLKVRVTDEPLFGNRGKKVRR